MGGAWGWKGYTGAYSQKWLRTNEIASFSQNGAISLVLRHFSPRRGKSGSEQMK